MGGEFEPRRFAATALDCGSPPPRDVPGPDECGERGDAARALRSVKRRAAASGCPGRLPAIPAPRPPLGRRPRGAGTSQRCSPLAPAGCVPAARRPRRPGRSPTSRRDRARSPGPSSRHHVASSAGCNSPSGSWRTGSCGQPRVISHACPRATRPCSSQANRYRPACDGSAGSRPSSKRLAVVTRPPPHRRASTADGAPAGQGWSCTPRTDRQRPAVEPSRDRGGRGATPATARAAGPPWAPRT